MFRSKKDVSALLPFSLHNSLLGILYIPEVTFKYSSITDCIQIINKAENITQFYSLYQILFLQIFYPLALIIVRKLVGKECSRIRTTALAEHFFFAHRKVTIRNNVIDSIFYVLLTKAELTVDLALRK